MEEEPEFEFEGFGEQQMELLMESDEEEASLIEEMEKQAVNISLNLSEGVKKQLEEDDISVRLEQELKESAQAISECLAQRDERYTAHDADSLAQELEREAGGIGYNLGYKNANYVKKLNFGMMTMPEDVSSYLKLKESGAKLSSTEESETGDIDALHKKVLQTVLHSTDMVTPVTEVEESNETVGNLDGVQILQLDMSAQDLILAKSAAAFKFHDEGSPSKKMLTYEKLQRLSAVLATSEGFLGGNEKVETGMSDRERMMLKKILEPGRKKKTSKKPPLQKRMITKPKHVRGNEVGNIKKEALPKQSIKKTVITEEMFKRLPENDNSSSQAKKPKSGTDSKPVISFHCSFCTFKCTFTKENKDMIVEHMTPNERYNQLFQVPPKMKNFKENVKLSVMVAKNKSKAQIRFLNRLECNKCFLQLPLNIENCDQIVIHHFWCLKLYSGAKTLNCLFCNKDVARSYIRKHLGSQCKRRCSLNVATILQMMSCVCRKYAEDHKPVCVVCNDKCWPYLGHRAELDPVCEPCRYNIISGNTTKLLVRDVTGCAICSKYCSKKFVTYWASELESLFIGERCIEKLKEPIPEDSEEIIAMKKIKIQKLVDLAVDSVRAPHSVENLRRQFSDARAVETVDENLHRQFSDARAVEPADESKEDSNHERLSTSIPQCDNTQEESLPPVEWDEPLQRVSVKCIPGQVNGSYKIFGSNQALPFTTITTNDENDTNSTTENQTPVTYAVLVPKPDNKKDVAERAINNDFGILENNFQLGEFPLRASDAVVSGAPKLATQVKGKRTTTTKKKTKNMKRLRIEGGGQIYKVVSRMKGNEEEIQLKTTMKSPNFITLNMDSENSSELNTVKEDGGKYIIKFASYDSKSKTTNNKEETDGNDNHIVIKTKSTTSQPKVNNIAPPRIAHVIRTQSSVINNKWATKKKSVCKPHSSKTTENPIILE
ncbi:hypothetical protein Pcinc_025521 [Petrolisthes cinctipes]|uniref:Uncharacterized protein n=1 Tax=Petrolisthes cinctipes TaxID=88211 RepID=A0AAE1F8E5_PETCI|nr:hypothetical protein Pcinc_025521 [Petrolisthes cinctipes]